jgi:Zn-dependent peptidase ImmA (M78 family)
LTLVLAHMTQKDAVERFVGKAKRLVDISGVKAPPVNPSLLAKVQGIRRIVLSNSLETSGQLVREGQQLSIKLNANEPVQRRNFSCCHEIAHAFVFCDSPTKSRVAAEVFSCSPSSFEEYLCDRAAAEMLMPEKFFRPRASDLGASIESLSDLAKTFGSSVSATMIRIGQLAVWPVVFIIWKFANGFESSRKLRVFWSVRPAGSRCYVPRHAAADPKSGIYATLSSSHPTCENETLDLGSLRGKYLLENSRFGDYVVSIVYTPNLRRA